MCRKKEMGKEVEGGRGTRVRDIGREKERGPISEKEIKKESARVRDTNLCNEEIHK